MPHGGAGQQEYHKGTVQWKMGKAERAFHVLEKGKISVVKRVAALIRMMKAIVLSHSFPSLMFFAQVRISNLYWSVPS